MPASQPLLIDATRLFAPLHQELIALLRTFTNAQWDAPTVAGAWRVRDIVAHLWQGDLARLSAHRDGHKLPPPGAVSSYEDVLAIINAANRDAVAAARKHSTRVLLELIEESGVALAAFVETLDLLAPALYPVAWAGEDESLNWMDIGREYTERWHHQQQIRDAVGAPLLLAPEWVEPLFALSVRALPRTYAHIEAHDGTTVVIRITGCGDWTLSRSKGLWEVAPGAAASPSTSIRVTSDVAWRIFYNALQPDAAMKSIEIEGDRSLAEPFLRTRSVMV